MRQGPGGGFRMSRAAVPAAVSVVSLAGALQLAAAPPSFTGIGDLSTGNTLSALYGVSGDGSVVVGYSHVMAGNQAIRWTAVDGLEPIGELPGGGFESIARGVSIDGTIIVGDSSATGGYFAFRWTDPASGGTGMVSIGDLPGGDPFSYGA